MVTASVNVFCEVVSITALIQRRLCFMPALEVLKKGHSKSFFWSSEMIILNVENRIV